jgi:hypothetical protein
MLVSLNCFTITGVGIAVVLGILDWINFEPAQVFPFLKARARR